MKKSIILLTMMAIAVGLNAQTKSSVETKALQQEFNQAKSVNAMSKNLLERFPVRYHKGVATIGVVGQVNETFNPQSIELVGGKVTSRVADIVSMRIPVSSLASLDNCNGLLKYSVAHYVAPDCNNTRSDTRTDSVQAGLGLPQPFDGEGVLVGITDWGFDYRHPNINSEEERRICRAWDHYKRSGPAPEGFDYGTEFVGYDQIYEAVGDTFGLYGYGSHGTHVAGIIGGRGNRPAGNANNSYIGQAPKVQYLLGSWLLDEAAWLDQVAWMSHVAKEEGKRLVINSSWGMYTFSNLDGTSLLSQAIDHYADSGIVFVTSAGNNGDCRFHLQHTFGNDDTLRTIPEWGDVGEALIFWGTPGKPFKVSIRLTGNLTADTIWTPWFSTDSNISFQEHRFVNAEGDTIRLDVMTEGSNMNSQRPHILINLDKIPRYRPLIYVVSDSTSTVDLWNVGNVRNHAGNTGYNFSGNQLLHATGGDSRYQVSEPGCAHKTITVAAHQADAKSDTAYTTGEITYFSSNGPAHGDYQKPEISAPGWQVTSSINSRDESNYVTVTSVNSNGTRYRWASMSGTSMSSPAVTGIVALMLQANPTISVDQIRNIIFTTARNDDKTGALLANDSASYTWGWGKIDAMRCVAAAYDLNSIDQAIALQPKLMVYPNPTTSQATIITSTNEPSTLKVYGMDGRIVETCTIGNETSINTSEWPRGIYVLQVHGKAGVRTTKLAVM